jgi:hypothetical protein
MVLGQGQRRLAKYIECEKQFSIKVISYFYNRVRSDVAVVTVVAWLLHNSKPRVRFKATLRTT